MTGVQTCALPIYKYEECECALLSRSCTTECWWPEHGSLEQLEQGPRRSKEQLVALNRETQMRIAALIVAPILGLAVLAVLAVLIGRILVPPRVGSSRTLSLD